MKSWLGMVSALSLLTGGMARAEDHAEAFGAIEAARSVRLSPAGDWLSWVTPGPGRDSVLMVAPVDGSVPPKAILRSGTDRGFRMSSCDWVGNEDLWCSLIATASRAEAQKFLTYQRLLAVRRDGTGMRPLGRPISDRALGYSNYDGQILYTLKNEPAILMQSFQAEEDSSGTLVYKKVSGIVVEKVSFPSGRRTPVEKASRVAAWYLTDQEGNVRMMAASTNDSDHYDTGERKYFLRAKGSKDWVQFGADKYYGRDFQPLSFDDSGDWLYVKARNAKGHLALYRYPASGSGKPELVFEHESVDVDGLETLGAQDRVTGYSYTDGITKTTYLDGDLDKIHTQIERVVKGTPAVGFTGENTARDRLLIYAGSDTDPGRYFLLDRKTRQLREVLPVRAGLADVPMGTTTQITYPARDGTKVPAYLTLPAGKPDKKLPLIVMPHGGPSARDYWGFDWLVQFYAANGFAVLQPNYRGSTGFGKEWNTKTAIENWRQAISDVNDSAHAMVAQGIADPAKLAVVGWSYGGYAALQGNAMEPDLYKATVAIAPVTDWIDLKRAATDNDSTADKTVAGDFGTSNSNLVEGSPVHYAEKFRSPVLMFHGDRDANVLVDQSKEMDAALRKAGKQSELVIYPGLDHQLVDGQVRTEMLRKSLQFITQVIGPVAPATTAKVAAAN